MEMKNMLNEKNYDGDGDDYDTISHGVISESGDLEDEDNPFGDDG